MIHTLIDTNWRAVLTDFYISNFRGFLWCVFLSYVELKSVETIPVAIRLTPTFFSSEPSVSSCHMSQPICDMCFSPFMWHVSDNVICFIEEWRPHNTFTVLIFDLLPQLQKARQLHVSTFHFLLSVILAGGSVHRVVRVAGNTKKCNMITCSCKDQLDWIL